MPINPQDVVALNQVRARLTDLAEQAHRGAEKLITKNGQSYIALVGADRLAYYHRLEREHIHLLLLQDSERGLDDVAAGRVYDIEALRRRHGR